MVIIAAPVHRFETRSTWTVRDTNSTRRFSASFPSHQTCPPCPVPAACRASFLGAYRLVPPFRAPIGCPAIPACAQHSRLKHGCRCCEDVAQRSAAASAPAEDEGESEETARDARGPLGLPLPPAKFYKRARVSRERDRQTLPRGASIFFLVL